MKDQKKIDVNITNGFSFGFGFMIGAGIGIIPLGIIFMIIKAFLMAM